MFFAPANVGRKLIAGFSISIFPFRTTVVAATLSEHWLFRSIADAPGVAVCHVFWSSFSKLIWLGPG
jgi:hypothetical protein